MNYIPIICPVCNNRLTYIHRVESDFYDLSEYEYWQDDFHSLFCNHQNVTDIFARDSHALFNFNEDWSIAHLHVNINELTINQGKYISITKNNKRIFYKEISLNINWLSLDSIKSTIQTLLIF